MSNEHKERSDSSVLPVGGWGGILCGIALFLAGLYSFTAPEPPPLPLSFSLVTIGFCGALSSFFALRLNRLAWGFSTSINGTLGVVMIFAAPRVRDQFEIDYALAMIPAVLFLVITVLLALSSPELEA
ncbi:MAG: hypothetical protein KJO07_12820 [Deltaproteobacteria bacterium]|nr:hypothetical protein [Deltaproteobacteria bacterium]